MSRKSLKVAGFGAAVTGAVAAVALAVPATGAYFSDSHPVSASGSIGSVQGSVSGDLTFAGLLPGEPNTQTETISNPSTSTGPETFHFTMDSAALNTLKSQANAVGLGGTAVNIDGHGYTVATLPTDLVLGNLNPGQSYNVPITVTLPSSLSDSRYEGVSIPGISFNIVASQLGH
jgi:hypothetical protein